MIFLRNRYDGMQVFLCNEDVCPLWLNTMSGKRGILSLSNMRPTYIFKRVIPFEIYDWAMLKIIDVSRMKISNSNLAITMKIAKSMMIKSGYNKYSIELILSKIKEKAIEVIDIKQYEWEKVLESQTRTMPF
jgi:hypothetical protein